MTDSKCGSYGPEEEDDKEAIRKWNERDSKDLEERKTKTITLWRLNILEYGWTPWAEDNKARLENKLVHEDDWQSCEVEVPE